MRRPESLCRGSQDRPAWRRDSMLERLPSQMANCRNRQLPSVAFCADESKRVGYDIERPIRRIDQSQRVEPQMHLGALTDGALDLAPHKPRRWRPPTAAERQFPSSRRLPQAKANRCLAWLADQSWLIDSRPANGSHAMIDEQIKLDELFDIAEGKGADGYAGLARCGESPGQLPREPRPPAAWPQPRLIAQNGNLVPAAGR